LLLELALNCPKSPLVARQDDLGVPVNRSPSGTKVHGFGYEQGLYACIR
jgi:hypothetical protein